MKGSEFVFDYVQFLYYKCHKKSFNRGEPYIDSPDYIKDKKATINSINKKDHKCFNTLYCYSYALNYKEIEKRSVKNNKN